MEHANDNNIDHEVSQDYIDMFNNVFELFEKDPVKAQELKRDLDKQDLGKDDPRVQAFQHGEQAYKEDLTRLPDDPDRDKDKSPDKDMDKDKDQDKGYDRDR